MKTNKAIRVLVITNLILLAVHFFIRLPFVIKILSSLWKFIIVPVLISMFVFYLLKPMNEGFKRKGLKPAASALLAVIIAMVVVFAVVEGLGYYFVAQLNNLMKQLSQASQGGNPLDLFSRNLKQYVNVEKMLESTLDSVKNDMLHLESGVVEATKELLNLFSNLLLIIIIVFFLLKDGNECKEHVASLFPSRYRDRADEILVKCDEVLSHYVIGQASVAMALASMIFIGYLIIGMPSGLMLASTTLVLAFIPFIGFFISMIIPYVIAISMGLNMVLKLTVLFIIAQTLKGRVVVPAIMSKAMDIHPLTDIFLVIAAAAIMGPIGAFIIVPLYSVLKVVVHETRDLDLYQK